MKTYRLALSILVVLFCFYTGCTKKPSIKRDPIYIGVYKSDIDKKVNKKDLFLGDTTQVLSTAFDFSKDFPEELCRSILEQNAIPHIQLNPWLWGDEESIQYSNILNGEWDDFLTGWARNAEVFEYPVMISFAPDFNLEDRPWSVSKNDKDPEAYLRAFRYVVTLFRQEGAQNIIWVWQPHVESHPEQDWNNPWRAFPGKDVVDWVGASGFFDTKFRLKSPKTYHELFGEFVRDLGRFTPKKPILLYTEVKENDTAFLTDLTVYLQSTLAKVNTF